MNEELPEQLTPLLLPDSASESGRRECLRRRSRLRTWNHRAIRRKAAPELSYGRHDGPPSYGCRTAAVLAAIYPYRGQWHVPLIVRPHNAGVHAGQIAFPGGVVEYGETTGEAAIREFGEELGSDGGIQLLGRLSETYVFVSDFRIVPWVGRLASRPAWHPSREEVAALLEVPLRDLAEEGAEGRAVIRRGPIVFASPCLVWRDHQIWGATNIVLHELLELVRTLGP